MSNIDKQAQGEKTREAFERWAEQSGALPWGILKKHRNQDGTYPGPHYTYMWHAWNACYEALLDELAFLDKRNAELNSTLERWAVDRAQSASELDDAEKRIAELQVLAFCPAILDVISERQRQRAVEGWTSEHDDAYQNSELADAAACYAINAHNQGFSTPAHWPWDPDWWKQSGPRRDLVKAGALILAEIERIDRAAAGKGE